MKLLIATGLYAPDIGGPATYTAFLEKHLPRFGVAFAVVPFREVRRYPKLIRHIVYFIQLIRQGRNADIIYALDTVSVGLPAALASTLLRKRFFLRVPGDYAWEQGQQRFGLQESLDEYLMHPRQAPLLVRILARIQRFVARRAERIIVPSDYMKTIIAKWGVAAENVTRIYSALKTIEIPEAKEALRAGFGYEGFVVVTAARLVPWKGVSALIETVVKVRSDGVPISLKVIGEGTQERTLKEQVAKMGADGFVTFLSALPRDVLGRHLKAADAFVLNTSYEGLSHQLIEVMSIATPIVTTSVGGNLELIEDGENGLLVGHNDILALTAALKRLASEPELGLMLAQNAEKKVARFHENIVIEEFVRLIQ